MTRLDQSGLLDRASELIFAAETAPAMLELPQQLMLPGVVTGGLQQVARATAPRAGQTQMEQGGTFSFQRTDLGVVYQFLQGPPGERDTYPQANFPAPTSGFRTTALVHSHPDNGHAFPSGGDVRNFVAGAIEAGGKPYSEFIVTDEGKVMLLVATKEFTTKHQPFYDLLVRSDGKLVAGQSLGARVRNLYMDAVQYPGLKQLDALVGRKEPRDPPPRDPIATLTHHGIAVFVGQLPTDPNAELVLTRVESGSPPPKE